MIIKSHEDNRTYYFVLILLILIMCCYLLYISPKPFLYVNLIFIIFFSIYTLLNFIMIFKTLTFSKDGIEVSILFYKKFYRWNELKFRQLESYNKYFFVSNGRRTPPYVRCVKFYKKEIKNSRNKNPEITLGIIRPLSFIFVNFFDENITEEELYGRRPPIFVYNEKEFFKKMKEWNVEIKESL